MDFFSHLPCNISLSPTSFLTLEDSTLHTHNVDTQTHTHLRNIRVTMAMVSEVSLVSGEGVALRTLLLCHFKDKARRAARRRHCDFYTKAVCVCVSKVTVHKCVCVCVCVIGRATRPVHRNAGQDVGRKFQKQQTQSKNTP